MNRPSDFSEAGFCCRITLYFFLMSTEDSDTAQTADNIALRYLELPLAGGSTAKIAEVSLARPHKLNGLTLPMLSRLSS